MPQLLDRQDGRADLHECGGGIVPVQVRRIAGWNPDVEDPKPGILQHHPMTGLLVGREDLLGGQ